MPFVSVAPVQIATNAEATAGANAKKALSPAALFSTLAKSHGTSGYQKLPNGLIIQWGTVSAASAASNQSIVFPIAFPNACLSFASGMSATDITVSGYVAYGYYYHYSTSTTGVMMYYTMSRFWIAIGY